MNQHPEQMARDMIDAALEAAGWVVQDMRRVNLSAGPGVVSEVAVKEYRTDVGPADYVLFMYESAGGKTWFTDYRDPKPGAREVFRFHRPEALGR